MKSIQLGSYDFSMEDVIFLTLYRSPTIREVAAILIEYTVA